MDTLYNSTNIIISTDNNTLRDNYIQIFLPIFIGPIFVFFKILYDKWSFKRTQSNILKKQLRLDKITKKLQDFYWPLYIRLMRDFEIWSRFTIYDEEYAGFVQSDSESDIDEDDIHRCIYICRKLKNGIPLEYKCGNPVPKNAVDKHSPYCLRHIKYRSFQQLTITQVDNQTNFASNVVDIPVLYPNNTPINNQNYYGGFSDDSYLRINSNINPEKPDLNTSKLSEDNCSFSKHITISEKLQKNLLRQLVRNHNDISKIITHNIAYAEPNSKIGKQLIKYLKFSTILDALIHSKERPVLPENYEAPYPKKLLPLIENKVFKLQKEYNLLIENFY